MNWLNIHAVMFLLRDLESGPCNHDSEPGHHGLCMKHHLQLNILQIPTHAWMCTLLVGIFEQTHIHVICSNRKCMVVDIHITCGHTHASVKCL